MALILPSNVEFKNYAEKKVYKYIEENLPNNYISYYNYYIDLSEFDFAILIPGKGIAIIEVKGIFPDRILEVVDRNLIRYEKGNEKIINIPSPLKQTNTYRYLFVNKIIEEVGKQIKVLPFVCYPEITKIDYFDKDLDKVSPLNFTILKDNFKHQEALRNKILNTFQEYNLTKADEFNDETVLKIREFFEPKDQINFPEQIEQKERKDNKNIIYDSNNKDNRKYYSILKSIPANISIKKLKNIQDELFKEWIRGTKITLISSSDKILTKFKEYLFEKINELGLGSHLNLKDDEGNWKQITFNFFFYKVDTDIDELEVINCQLNESVEEVLEKTVSKESNFNINQYKLEHAQENKDIVVRAGAGTGKTFSMISRISYLLYINEMNAEKLKESIYMITFTTEAATNMKERLKEYLMKYYLLTQTKRYFKMIEVVEEMNISTIHALSRKIIKKYAAKLGFGKNISITSGIYQRNKAIGEVLDKYIDEKNLSEAQELSAISMYNLQKRLKLFIKKVEGKSVDILDEELKFGKPEYSKQTFFHNLFPEVLKRSEKKVRKKLKENNVLRLSDLIIKFIELIEDKNLDFKNLGIEYLFIDEFQDTDNRQIELFKKFQKSAGFNLFIVGDINQCIYRFRGADDEAFERIVDNNWLEFSLTKNYRTDRKLLDEFNNIFGEWGKLLNFSNKNKIYSLLNKNKDENFFERIDVKEEIDNKIVKKVKEEYENLNNHETVAILVRTNKEVKRIKKLETDIGYFVSTDVGGEFYKLDPILDMYKLILALQFNKNPKYLFNLYSTSYITKRLPKKKLYKNRNNRNKLLKIFEDENPILGWGKYLSDLKTKPILKVLRQISKDLVPWNKYGEEKGKDKNGIRFSVFYKKNLEKLFEKINEIGHTDYLTINNINKHLKIMILTGQEENKRKIEFDNISEGKNIVCMTVHKAKGLEYETVIMPFTGNELIDKRRIPPVDIIINDQKEISYQIRLDSKIPGMSSKYIKNNFYLNTEDKDLEAKKKEEARILYVSMTRAIKRFIFFNNVKTKTNQSWRDLIERGEKQ
jgi:superfamily I DNA/RNA helicase